MTRTNKASNSPFIKPALIVDEAQYERLLLLAADAAKQAGGLGTKLLEEVERAELRSAAQVPEDVVTIGSDVTFWDSDRGRTETVRIVFPEDANIDELRISILTPIGAALLGLSAGQEIWWEMADGRVKHLTVMKVRRSPRSIDNGVSMHH